MIRLTKEITKKIEKGNKYYNEDSFIEDCKAYVKAIDSGRMFCNIRSVSQSGMSRVISFSSCEKRKSKQNWYRQYNMLFTILGYKEVNRGGFRIRGCGMDMVFHTNYTIIRELRRMGFISKAKCEILCQRTPTII